MNRWVSFTLVLGAFLLLRPGATAAQCEPGSPTCPPTPGNSTIPPTLVLSPLLLSGELPPQVEAVAIIRDAANNVVPNAVVEIDLSCATSTGEFFLAASQPFQGVSINCAGKRVAVVSDASGRARFRVAGHVSRMAGSAGMTFCAGVYVDGVIRAAIGTSAVDQNGSSGVNPADANLFLVDRDNASSPKNQTRSDFNGSGSVNPADGAILLTISQAYAAMGGSTTPSACP